MKTRSSLPIGWNSVGSLGVAGGQRKTTPGRGGFMTGAIPKTGRARAFFLHAKVVVCERSPCMHSYRAQNENQISTYNISAHATPHLPDTQEESRTSSSCTYTHSKMTMTHMNSNF